MAQQLPGPPPPPGNRWDERPLAYERYRTILESYLTHLEREGIVVARELSFFETAFQGRLAAVTLRGEIAVASGGELHVDTALSVVASSPPVVQGRRYRYHGLVRWGPDDVQDLFRYDNSHGDTSTLHRHCFDVEGREIDVVPVTLEELPSLAEAIRQAEFYAAFLRNQRG